MPGAGDPVPVRTYSLSGDPDGGEYRISVKRESHGLVSRYLHEHLRPGDRIEVAAPRGDFVLDEGTDPVLLVSAGIGVTPVLAMLHRLASEDSTREVWWIHTHARRGQPRLRRGGRATCSAGCRPRTRSSPTRRPPSAGPGLGRARRDGSPRTWSRAWACRRTRAPTSAARSAFMDDVAAALTGVGIAPDRIHTERFGVAVLDQPGRRRA